MTIASGSSRLERRVLTRVSLAAWRLEQAERERTWALVSARAEGISIRTLATAAGLSPSRVHQIVAAADLDPASGQARLSYEMAGQLFKRYSGGKTLHQLRHSRLTHLGEANVSAPLLMAISGHKRLATLQRYVKPSQAAVAALVASRDPDRRDR